MKNKLTKLINTRICIPLFLSIFLVSLYFVFEPLPYEIRWVISTVFLSTTLLSIFHHQMLFTIRKYLHQFTEQRNNRSVLVTLRQIRNITCIFSIISAIVFYFLSPNLISLFQFQNYLNEMQILLRIGCIAIIGIPWLGVLNAVLRGIGKIHLCYICNAILYIGTILGMLVGHFIVQDAFVVAMISIMIVPVLLFIVYAVLVGIFYSQISLFIMKARLQEERAIGRKKIRKLLLFENLHTIALPLLFVLPFVMLYFLSHLYMPQVTYAEWISQIVLYFLPLSVILFLLMNPRNTTLAKKLSTKRHAANFEKQLTLGMWIGVLPMIVIYELSTFDSLSNPSLQYGVIAMFFMGLNGICAQYLSDLRYRKQIVIYFLIAIVIGSVTSSVLIGNLGAYGGMVSFIIMEVILLFLLFIKIVNKKEIRLHRLGLIVIRIMIGALSANGILVLCKYGLTYVPLYPLVLYAGGVVLTLVFYMIFTYFMKISNLIDGKNLRLFLNELWKGEL